MSDRAFVVMQIGSEGSPERRRADEVYEYIIAPALAAFSIEPYRSDLDPTPGAVTAKMLKELVEARLVVADLTGRNPNVFYELGITHSFSRPLISIADSASQLPFDAKDERIIQLGAYPESGLAYAQGKKAKANLIAALEVVLADGYEPPSPLRDVAANRSLDEMAPENPIASELADVRATVDEIRDSLQGPTFAVPAEYLEDARVLREVLSDNWHRLSDTDRLHLITDQTSRGHDQWVRSQMNVGAQDPWPSVAPSSDEPPF